MKENRDSTYFSSVGSIVEGISSELGLERGLKIVSLAKMWPKIVGPRFENTSRVYTVQQKGAFDIIIVAVSSSAVSQELVFHKNDVIKKIYKVAKGLDFKIKDIQFSTKFWR